MDKSTNSQPEKIEPEEPEIIDIEENEITILTSENTENTSLKRSFSTDPENKFFNPFKSRRLQRLYRPRKMDSDSEDDYAEAVASFSNTLNNKETNKCMSDTLRNVVDLTEDNMHISPQNDCMNVANNPTNGVQEDYVGDSVNLSNEIEIESTPQAGTSENFDAERTSNTRTRKSRSSSCDCDDNEQSSDEENNRDCDENEQGSAEENDSQENDGEENNNDGDENELVVDDLDGEENTLGELSFLERMDLRIRTQNEVDQSVECEVENVMGKELEKHYWNPFNALRKREQGMSGRRELGRLFSLHCYDSLYIVQRMQMAGELEFHRGCTNALNFSDDGNFLASSSDDLQVAVWDWAKRKTITTYDSGHRSNVLQCKFLPLPGNGHIVTCSRDGTVRLKDLTSSALRERPRRIARHSRSAHKVSTRRSAPYCVMSAGEDALVYHIDIRSSNRPDKIVEVTNGTGALVPLYSIDQNPANDNQFCVTGQDEFIRIYDRRVISPFGPSMVKYCPGHIIGRKRLRSVTCGVYNQGGDALVASYGEEDIYVFDTSRPEGSEHLRQFSGHCNISTVKGVNFFGPSGSFIVSGSDCGNIFFWDVDSEAIVNFMKGDYKGIVNVLEPHPYMPVMATSGLDNSVKLWSPNFSKEPQMEGLENLVRANVCKREDPDIDDLDDDDDLSDDPQMGGLHNLVPDNLIDMANYDHVNDDQDHTGSTSEDSSSSDSFAAAMEPNYEENSDTNPDNEGNNRERCNTQ